MRGLENWVKRKRTTRGICFTSYLCRRYIWNHAEDEALEVSSMAGRQKLIVNQIDDDLRYERAWNLWEKKESVEGFRFISYWCIVVVEIFLGRRHWWCAENRRANCDSARCGVRGGARSWSCVSVVSPQHVVQRQISSSTHLGAGHANLRSTVREAPVRSIFRQHFFSFLETFLSFSEKNKFRHFFMSQKNFQVKIWWVEKISRNKLVR